MIALRRKAKTAAKVAAVGAVLYPATVQADTIRLSFAELEYRNEDDIVKVRPYVNFAPSDVTRTDVMIGHRFKLGEGTFTPYFHFQADSQDRVWAGTRMDYNFNPFEEELDGKLNANLQLRLFRSMNDRAGDKAYFIPSASYNLFERPEEAEILRGLDIGAIGYLKVQEEKDPVFYLGPCLKVDLSKNISGSVSYLWDCIGKSQDDNMAVFSLCYKFK
jgi:hypothetical protein